MTAGPFDEPEGRYLVLVDDGNQHSLWPSSVGVPAGWRVVFGQTDRRSALDYIEENWTALRPQAPADRTET